MSLTRRTGFIVFLGFARLLAPALAEARQVRPSDGLSTPEPVHIFLTPPLRPDELWKSLERPDFVLISGATYQRLMGGNGSAPTTPTPVVNSVAVSGRVGDEIASLVYRIAVTTPGPGRHSLPLMLNGVAGVSAVREGDRDLALFASTNGGWTVELDGAGRHVVVVEAMIRTGGEAEERRLTVPVPVCPATSIDVGIERKILDASVGDGEPVGVTVSPNAPTSTVSARLSPRDKILLTWRPELGEESRLPPMLNADGEMSLDVDPDLVLIRSAWQIASIRGVCDSLKVSLDPADELLEVDLNGRAVSNRLSRDPKTSKLMIALLEPLRQGKSLRLKMTTRRRLKRGTTNRVVFTGYPFENAQIQTGAVAVSKARPVFVEGSVGRSLRRVDPRSELPNELRTRPGTVLAYQFVDQPFELNLVVAPAPPIVRVEPKTTAVVAADRVTLDAWMDYHTSRGQVYDVGVELAPGLEIDGFGPPETVESAEYVRQDSEGGKTGARRLLLHLTAKARESGVFRIHLTGRHPLASAGAGARESVDLFRPLGDAPLGGLVALIGAPGIDIAPRDSGGTTSPPGWIALDSASPPTDWIWPADLAAESKAVATWLRQSSDAARLPIRMERRVRNLTHESNMKVDVERRWVDVEQDVLVSIPFGTIRKLDVVVPKGIAGWTVETPVLRSNDVLAIEKDGSRRHRLTLDRDADDSVRFRFHHRLPLITSAEPSKVVLPTIRPTESTLIAESVRIGAQPAVGLMVEARGWETIPLGDRARDRFRLSRQSDAGNDPILTVSADPIVELPELVASRLLLRTSRTSDGARSTQARFAIDAHGPVVGVALPSGARWSRVAVNDEDVAEIERGEGRDEYRIVLPENFQTGAIELSLLYSEPAAPGSAPFVPPQLMGGVVRQTYWEVDIPWNELVLGSPTEWNDENVWSWSYYVWKRRPALSPSDLEGWLTGDAESSGDSTSIRTPSSHHGYLFGRAGAPPQLRLRVLSKALVLGICTGVVSLVGVIAVGLRTPVRVQILGAVLAGFGATIAWDAGVAFTLLQSSSFGVAIVVSALLSQSVVDRRRGRRGLVRERLGSTLTRIPAASTTLPTSPQPLGSDDSTAVRVRRPPEDERLVLTPDALGHETSGGGSGENAAG